MSVNVCNELRRAKSRLSNSCLTEGAELTANSLNSEEISVGCVGCSTVEIGE